MAFCASSALHSMRWVGLLIGLHGAISVMGQEQRHDRFVIDVYQSYASTFLKQGDTVTRAHEGEQQRDNARVRYNLCIELT